MENLTRDSIVVIDDHCEHLNYVTTLLRRVGHVVAGFERARSALNYLAYYSASLVITDVFMPEMDGFEVLKELQRRYPRLPLIAVSSTMGSERAHYLVAIKHLGARAVFTKPLDADALLDAVARLTGGTRRITPQPNQSRGNT